MQTISWDLLPQAVVNGLLAGSTYALVALSFGLIYNTTHFFHFAHGAVYTVGAYCVFALLKFAGLPPLAAIALAATAAGALGAALELLLYRPLRNSGASPLVLLLASLGVFIVIQNAIALTFGAEVQLLRGNFPQRVFNLLGTKFTASQSIVFIVNALLCVAVWAFLRFSMLGREVRAVMSDQYLAYILGVRSERIILFVFVVSSALAGLAGILIGLDTDLTPMMGFRAVTMGVIAFIVGGVGASTFSSVLGGLFIGLIQHLSGIIISNRWQDTVVFITLMLFLLLRPQGFMGTPLKRSTI